MTIRNGKDSDLLGLYVSRLQMCLSFIVILLSGIGLNISIKVEQINEFDRE